MSKALSGKLIILTLLLVLCSLLCVPGKTVHAFTGNNNPAYGYAFDYRLDSQIVDLPFDEFVTSVNSKALNFGGTVTTEKVVFAENGISRVVTRNVYDVRETTFKIYFPHITIASDISDDADITEFIRLKNSPVTGYKFRYEAERDSNDRIVTLKAGTYDGLTMQMYLSKERSVCTPSTAPVEIEVFDGTEWCDIVMPTGTNYNITSVEDTSATPNPALANGLSASIDDCSINAVLDRENWDRTGVTIRLSGAKFTLNAGRKYHDVTNWFTNLPEGMYAMVSTNVTEEDPSTVHIIFARWIRAKVSMSWPRTVKTDPITVTIPFDDIVALDGSRPWSGLKGGVVVSENAKAVYNFLAPQTIAAGDAPLIVTSTFSGMMLYKEEDGKTVYRPIYGGHFYTYVFVPSSVYDALVEEKEQTGAQKAELKIKLVPDRDIFENDNSNVIYATCTSFAEISGSGLYYGSLSVEDKNLIAKDFGTGRFTASWVIGDRETKLDPSHNFVFYNISEMVTPENYDEDNPYIDPGEGGNGLEEGDNGENNSDGGSGSASDPGGKPDIWVNGKDIKDKNDSAKTVYNKTYKKVLSDLKVELPEDCKWVVSVTDTAVTEASGAYVSGKAKKSNLAKASFKSSAEGGNITVTSGKEAGTARIWIAAVDKKKEIKASAYFDVKVGIAPKKLYLTKTSKGEKSGAVKSIMLNMGDEESIFVNADGTELSAYSTFKWDASSDKDGLLNITPSGDKQSATISLSKAPSDGKVKKVKINIVCNESGKKATITVMVANAVKSFSGLDTAVQMDSAAEKAVDKELAIEAVCSASGTPTDKIKVYVTTALKEGEGYQVANGKKFSLDSSTKPKIKASYKNGKFTVTAPKGTADGTKVRVLIAVTHGDKTVDVFESGVITIGSAT